MYYADAKEGSQLLQVILTNLSKCIPPAGVVGVQARTAIGYTQANAYVLLQQNTIGPPLQQCFDLVVQAGSTRGQIDWVRSEIALMATPVTVGGAIVINSCTNLCLAAEADIIQQMTFTSYDDVINLIATLTPPFQLAIEAAADEMDQMSFQALIGLAAAVVNYLITTARPLPRLVNYQFAAILPTLVIAYRLYADASRADEIRDENKIVHPAFCPLLGRALSA